MLRRRGFLDGEQQRRDEAEQRGQQQGRRCREDAEYQPSGTQPGGDTDLERRVQQRQGQIPRPRREDVGEQCCADDRARPHHG